MSALLGAWLVVAPILLGYSADDPAWHDAVLGSAIVALVAARVRKLPWPAWPTLVIAGIGLWIFAAGLLLADTSVAAWNETVVGALVVLTALVAASQGGDPGRAAARP